LTDTVCCCFTECRAQQDNVLQPKGDVTATEGQTVTLGCQYKTSGTNNNLFWYKQDGNNRPKFILSRVIADEGNT
ncbi:immunoglobulin lambda-1 light chain-like, partial [Scomber scombrus]